MVRRGRDGLVPLFHLIFFLAECVEEDSKWSLSDINMKFCEEVSLCILFLKCKIQCI